MRVINFLQKNSKISTTTGISIVLANMIGTGVFTSLGFQLVDLRNTAVILTLWLLGGLLALAGAFSYSEVGSVMKKSGGEYVFLSRIYHPVIGYLAGWISMTVGFAAPIALSAMACMEYLPVNVEHVKLLSIGIIAVVTFIHTINLHTSSLFQSFSTFLKVGVMLAIIVAGLFLPGAPDNAIGHGEGYFAETGTVAFAVGLIYVSYAYSGWNAAAYITQEFKNPMRSLPVSLIGGTLLVMLLYTLLQYVFLKHASASELVGQLNVGAIAIQNMMGLESGKWFSLTISLLLISGISAMVWVGPRVTASMATDHRLWHFFRSSKDKIPRRSLWLQFAVSVLLILTGTFEQILVYCGVLLTIISMLVVAGVLLLRRKSTFSKKEKYTSPFYPIPQLFFLLVSSWMTVFAVLQYPLETVAGLVNVLIGLTTYGWSKYLENRRSTS